MKMRRAQLVILIFFFPSDPFPSIPFIELMSRFVNLNSDESGKERESTED